MFSVVQQREKALLSYFSIVSSCDHWVQPKSWQDGKQQEKVLLGAGALIIFPICSGWGHQAPCCASSCPASCRSRQILICAQFWTSFWGSPCQKLGFSLVYAWSWCNLCISQDTSKDGIDANKRPLGILSLWMGYASTVNSRFTRATASFRCWPASHSDHTLTNILHWSVLCVLYVFIWRESIKFRRKELFLLCLQQLWAGALVFTESFGC